MQDNDEAASVGARKQRAGFWQSEGHETNDVREPIKVRKEPFVLFGAWQWVMTIIFGFLLLMLLTMYGRTTLPGASPPLYYIACGAVGIAAVLLSAPVFFRLPVAARIALYVALVPVLSVFGDATQDLADAYSRTPAGAKEAAESAQREKRQREEQRIQAASDARTARDEAESANIEKVKGCLSWSGRFDPVEEEIKSRLHNPHSFEHVKTEVIGPTRDGDNLEITFRAENGFGALREGWARATIDPNSCELKSVGRLFDS